MLISFCRGVIKYSMPIRVKRDIRGKEYRECAEFSKVLWLIVRSKPALAKFSKSYLQP